MPLYMTSVELQRAGGKKASAPWFSHTDWVRSALSLHAVSFGSQGRSRTLRRMAEIATQVHSSTPCGPFPPLGTPCSYSTALDTVGASYIRSYSEVNH